MEKINIVDWGPFKIENLFTIVKGTRLTRKDMKEGDIRYVGASAFNNGVTNYIGNSENLHPGGTLTVSYNGSVGEVFYQDKEFWATDDVNVLYPKFSMDKYTALFIVSLIKSIGKNYGFVNKWKIEDMKRSIIYLPVDNEGQPNWIYIREYMQSFERTRHLFLNRIVEKKEYKNQVVDISKWKKFRVGELFYRLNLKIKKENFDKRFDTSMERTDEFSLPLVNAKDGNNGIMYYGRFEDFESAELCLDIVQNGAVATGNVYAQIEPVGVLWDAYLIKPYQTVKGSVLLFLSCVIQKVLKSKYSYDNKAVWDKVKEEYILLPINRNGLPNWDFMGKYIESKGKSVQSLYRLF